MSCHHTSIFMPFYLTIYDHLRVARMAFWMHKICCAMTLSTSASMRLNSSKQAQPPEAARPLKNFAMAK